MEVCVPSEKSPYLDGCSNRGSLKVPLKKTLSSPTDLSVSDLKTCLTEVLVGDGIDVKKSEKRNVRNVIWGHEINEEDLDKNKSTHSASENWKPSSSMNQPPLEVKQEQDSTDAGFKVNDVLTNSVNQSHLHPKLLPTGSKLLSAMKGSRAKQGMPPKKLSVTWAPDVYDPIPTSVSHVPSSKNQHYYRSHGKRKNKHKRGGKPSKSGGSSKDSREKKQTRKNVGTSLKPKPMLPDYDRRAEVFNERIGSSNAFCGSSLMLMNSEQLSPAEGAI